MRYSPNPYLVRFDGEHIVPPVEWTSKQAKRLYDAGADGETCGYDGDHHWINHAVGGTIRIALAPTHRAASKFGTDPKCAEAHARWEIARMRAEADRLERELNAYGGSAFIEKPFPVRSPKNGADAEEFLFGLMKSKATDIFVNGHHFKRDQGNVFHEVVKSKEIAKAA